MRKSILALLAAALLVPSTFATAQADVAAPIRQFIDGFNSGDTKVALAAIAQGDIHIIDEFAPFSWNGPNAAQDWITGYDKHAQATGVTDGIVKYEAPTRIELEGDLAYVILPTIYLYKEHGKPMAEEGQLTCVLRAEAGGWKISAWTWSGVKPHPAK
jgi:ketosteroid isomerase-like protein